MSESRQADVKAFADSIDIPVARAPKPREAGLNFVGDWGVGLPYLEGMLEAVGEYLDLVKTAVLSARLSSADFMRRKIALYAAHQVKAFPGGMSLEAALICKKVERFLDEARDLGFSVIEVSESEVRMTPDTSLRLIAMARERGFQVLRELGPHHATEPFSAGHIIKQCREALDAGAWKIVLEGEVIHVMKPWEDRGMAEKIMAIVDAIGVENMVFEMGGDLRVARWFLLNFGPECSFGNIGQNLDHLMRLEHVRRGLNYPETWFGKFVSL